MFDHLVFAECNILLVDNDDRCGMDETGLDPAERMSYLSNLTDYWATR